MKFVSKFDWFLFGSDTEYVTFIWMEAHEPILSPSCRCIEVFLEIFCILDRVNFFVYDTVVCK